MIVAADKKRKLAPYLWSLFALFLLAVGLVAAQTFLGIPFLGKVKLDPTQAHASEGLGAAWKLPSGLAKRPSMPVSLRGTVFEDGIALPSPKNSKRVVCEHGMGRYRIKGRILWVSSSDGTDPLTNGRSYLAVIPQNVRTPWIVVSLVGLAVSLVALLVVRPGLEPVEQFWAKLSRSGAQRVPFRLLTPVALVVVLLIRLYLVADEELVAYASDPVQYALPVLHPERAPVHPPGTAYVLGTLCYQLGVPYRLGIELLYFAATIIFARGILRVTGSRLFAFISVLLIAFHPWSFVYFRHYFSEGFVACCLLAAAGWMLSLLGSSSINWKTPALWLIGLALACWDLARVETPLVLATWLVFAAVCGWRFRREFSFTGFLKPGLLCLIPLVLLVTVHVGYKGYNLARHGVWMRCHIDNPGLKQALTALYRLKPTDSIRGIPVTRQSLRVAMSVSPTLRQFESDLMDPEGPVARYGEEYFGRKGEVGTSLIWHLLSCVPGTAAEKDRLFRQIAREIKDAISQKKVKGRFAIYPLDPMIEHWIPFIPASSALGLRALFSLPPWTEETDFGNSSYPENLEPYPQYVFDTVGMRRQALRGRQVIEIKGTIASQREGQYVVSIESADRILQTASCSVRRESTSTIERSGPARPGRQPARLKAHFALHTSELPRKASPEPELIVRLQETVVARSPVRELKEGSELSLPGEAGENAGTVKLQSVSRFSLPGSYHKVRAYWKSRVPTYYRLLFGIALPAVVLLGVTAAGVSIERRVLGASLLLLGGLLAVRFGFYVLVSAVFSWDLNRYLSPVSPFVYSGVLLAVFTAATLAPLPVKSRSGRQKPGRER